MKLEIAFSASSILKFQINLFGWCIEKLVDIVQIFCYVIGDAVNAPKRMKGYFCSHFHVSNVLHTSALHPFTADKENGAE